MGLGGKLVLVLVGAAMAVVLASQHGADPSKSSDAAVVPAAVAAAPDPQALLDEGLALEAAWKSFRSEKRKGVEPPNPLHLDRIDLAIGQIPQNWPKAEEAIALVRRLRAERPAIERAYDAFAAERAARDKAAREKALLEKRRRIADLIERTYLEAGQDLYASAEGPELRTLRLKYVLIGRPFVYKVQNDAKLRGQWLDMGFRKVVMTDGYGSTWTLKLD